MAELGMMFNNNEVERQVMQGGPLPSGTYAGLINKVTLKDTSKNDDNGNPTGKYIEVEFDILHPEQYKNRKVWDKINYLNVNPKTQKIGQEQVEDLRQACSIVELYDDQQLLGSVVQMEVIVELAEEYTDKFGNKKPGKDSNRILKYWHETINVAEKIAERKARAGKKSADANVVSNNQTGGVTAHTVNNAAVKPNWNAQGQPAQATQSTHQRPAATDPTPTPGNPMPWRQHPPK